MDGTWAQIDKTEKNRNIRKVGETEETSAIPVSGPFSGLKQLKSQPKASFRV